MTGEPLENEKKIKKISNSVNNNDLFNLSISAAEYISTDPAVKLGKFFYNEIQPAAKLNWWIH